MRTNMEHVISNLTVNHEYLSVVGTDANGCSGLPHNRKLSILSQPVVYTGGPTSFCQGDLLILLPPVQLNMYGVTINQ